MTPSSAYPRQRPSRDTVATTFVAFTARASCQLIARGAACSSVLLIYPGSQQRPHFQRMILSRMLDGSSVTGGKSSNRQVTVAWPGPLAHPMVQHELPSQ